MDSLNAGDLRIEVLDSSQSIQLTLKGKSNDRHPAKILGPYFADILTAAEKRRATVELHFEKLDHFNSSTITAIIQVIQEARGRGVPIVIVFDQALRWQKLSFDALRIFAKDDGLLQIRPS